MATYYLWSGAAGTGTGADWTNAFTTYTAALAAATASGDVVKVHKTHTEELAANTIFTHQNHISVICVDKDASDALATMGDTAWIGNSSASRAVTISGAFRLFFYGLTFRTAGGTSVSLNLSGDDGADITYEQCTLWHGNTSASADMIVGSIDDQAFTKFVNCVFRFGGTVNGIRPYARMDLIGCSLHPSSAVITNGLFKVGNTSRTGGASIACVGCDWSILGTNPIVGDATNHAHTTRLSQCKFGTGFSVLRSQTVGNRSSAEAYVFDCADGDTHGLFGYYNALGSVVSDTGIYFTIGAAAQSWKIVTTANCSYYTPFETPWFGYWNTATTAITPYVEILRDGSATAYQDDEVWLDVMAKTNTGSTQSALTTDRMTPLGTPANQDAGAGLGSWTGESGTAWSGKLAVASLTPAEVGRLSARVVVGEPSITVYADPQVRT